MLYHSKDELKKKKTQKDIIKEVGIFIEKNKMPEFARYFMKPLKIIIDGTTIRCNTPIEVIKVINSFKKEYDLLGKLLEV